MQSDREKEEGLPVAPFMDREKVTKPTAQIGFIKFVLLPMFETIAKARTSFDSLRVPQVSETKKRVVCIEQQSTTSRWAGYNLTISCSSARTAWVSVIWKIPRCKKKWKVSLYKNCQRQSFNAINRFYRRLWSQYVALVFAVCSFESLAIGLARLAFREFRGNVRWSFRTYRTSGVCTQVLTAGLRYLVFASSLPVAWGRLPRPIWPLEHRLLYRRPYLFLRSVVGYTSRRFWLRKKVYSRWQSHKNVKKRQNRPVGIHQVVVTCVCDEILSTWNNFIEGISFQVTKQNRVSRAWTELSICFRFKSIAMRASDVTYT